MTEKEHDLIDQGTIAVKPYFKDGYRSKITKKSGVFYSEKAPLVLINEACLNHASTLEGRKQAVREIFRFYKPPVIIAPYHLSFFPTASYSNFNCALIFNHPFRHIATENGVSRLRFYDSIDIFVNASQHTLIQQHQRLHMVINYYRDY